MDRHRVRTALRIALCAFLTSGSLGCGEDRSGSDDKSGKSDETPEVGPLEVQTTYGPVRGMAADSSRVFRAIRYAAPPVGPLRFTAPRPPEPWTAPPEPVSSVCPQLGTDNAVVGTEDCLILDVWTPFHAPAKPLPVMFWIHGGGFTVGTGYMTDALLPSRDVVVVSINYRLGPFGFLAHPALTQEGEGTSGNFAIQDQRLALEWVRDNIAAFGGDPKKVTIFGESAGGFAVDAHLWSAQSAGLFHRAIMQSGVGFKDRTRTLALSEAQGQLFAAAAGCTAADSATECLRQLPVDKVLTAMPLASWNPSLDGVVFARSPQEMLADGSFNRVPTIIGSNTWEGLGFLASQTDLTEEQYIAYIQTLYGGDAEKVVSLYPVSDFDSPQYASAAILGNSGFNCPARRAARALSEAGIDVYLYLFGQGLAVHAADLAYIFGIGALPSDQKVSSAMKDYWTEFAKTGDPNLDRQPKWPRYEMESDRHLSLADPIKADSHLLSDKCDFWDQRVSSLF
jgi:para-nitrobenzyl esterase